jgi:hypothetical protein
VASASPRTPRRLAIAALALAALAGCGDEDAETPAACLAGSSAYLDALRVAPEPVLLEGSTPISDCVPADQDAAELGQAGEQMITTATQLNAEARRDPSGKATVQLGYLIGAVQQGAAEGGGIHADLLRRLDAAARFKQGGKQLPASFERALGKGYAAGQETG